MRERKEAGGMRERWRERKMVRDEERLVGERRSRERHARERLGERGGRRGRKRIFF